MPIATFRAQFASAISIMGGSLPLLFNSSASILPDAVDLAAEREKGHVVSFGDRHYWVQHVVYTGIDIVRLNRIDVKQGTFNVDFYLWMRFAGDDDGQTQVQFPALLDRGAFDSARPVANGRGGRPQLSALSDQRGLQGAL